MTIEIHQPRLEALIEQRMASGHFQTVEDLLLQMLETSPDEQALSASKPPKQNLDEFLMASPLRDSGLALEREKQEPKRQNLADFLMASPLRGSGLKVERLDDYPRPIEL